MSFDKIKNKNKSKVAATILAGSILAGGVVHKANEVVDVTTKENPKPIEETIEKPFIAYGEFKDASNTEQVLARAEAYYHTYIANSEKSEKVANAISIEDIMDVIRLMNNEFILDENGKITFDPSDLDKAANTLSTISNCDSLREYKNKIFYSPIAPLLVDGSYAQNKAKGIDEKMEKVVKTIREDNKEEFVTATKEWFSSFTNMLDNMYDNRLGRPTSYLLFTGYYSKYVTSIYEYMENKDIKIVINSNQIPAIMNGINTNIINKREQSLPEELYSLACDYYNERYEREKESIIRL